MTGAGGPGAESSSFGRPTLPLRDYLLVPLISLVTVLVMFGVAEIVTRRIWVEQDYDECVSAPGAQPNVSCTFRAKNAEGPWSDYRYNECGYRSETSCGPKPPGTARIAIVGASASFGYLSPYEQTYFAYVSRELSRSCGFPVDVQNMGRPGTTSEFAFRSTDKALALDPDVILYLIVPYDVEQQFDAPDLNPRSDAKTARTPPLQLSLMRRIQIMITQSRAVLVAQHFLFQDTDTFLRLYLNYGDKADFLRQPFSERWQTRFANINLVMAGISEKAHARNVPLVLVPLPSRAEAALLSSKNPPPGADSFAFGRQIEKMAREHSAEYVELMEPFSRIPHSERLFYVVDGHATFEGQRVIGQQVVAKLLDGSVPAFAHCSATTAAAPR